MQTVDLAKYKIGSVVEVFDAMVLGTVDEDAATAPELVGEVRGPLGFFCSSQNDTHVFLTRLVAAVNGRGRRGQTDPTVPPRRYLRSLLPAIGTRSLGEFARELQREEERFVLQTRKSNEPGEFDPLFTIDYLKPYWRASLTGPEKWMRASSIRKLIRACSHAPDEAPYQHRNIELKGLEFFQAHFLNQMLDRDELVGRVAFLFKDRHRGRRNADRSDLKWLISQANLVSEQIWTEKHNIEQFVALTLFRAEHHPWLASFLRQSAMPVLLNPANLV